MSNHLEALNKNHDLNNFDCGVPALNLWIQTTASQHQAKLLSRTFVATSPNSPGILSFYALSMRGLTPTADIPLAFAKRLPTQISAITLARLAVSLNAQGQRVGEELLVDAMRRSKQTAMSVGGTFLFVDAKDANAAAFYAKYGFISLPDSPLILCFKINDIPD
jgi:ribosomal protein S18 acetylase RimI-like enzyme